MVAAAYAVLRAVEDGVRHPVRWLVLAGALVGLGLPDQDAAGLPGAAGVRAGLPGRRAAAGAASGSGTCWSPSASMIAAAGWWIAIVELWPAASRPYIGGSQDNSILELTLGYNGLGRLNGDETGSVGGGGGRRRRRHVGRDRHRPAVQHRDRRPDRLAAARPRWCCCSAASGSPPAARAPTGSRAALILWGGWLLVTGADLQLHGRHLPRLLHRRPRAGHRRARRHRCGTWSGSTGARGRPARSPRVAVALTTVTAFVLLGRSADFVPWLRWVVLAAGILAAAALAGLRWLPPVALAAAAARVAVLASLAGPAAYAVQTASTAHTGSIPSAGPTVAGGGFGGGPGGGPAAGGCGGPPGRSGQAPPRPAPHRPAPAGRPGGGRRRRPARAAASPAPSCGACSRRTPTTTPGSPPRSAPTTPPATSSPPRSR